MKLRWRTMLVAYGYSRSFVRKYGKPIYAIHEYLGW